MRVATVDDLDAVGETLARAFEHDPLWGWAFEDAERERKLASLTAVFRSSSNSASSANSSPIPTSMPRTSVTDSGRLSNSSRTVGVCSVTVRLSVAFPVCGPPKPRCSPEDQYLSSSLSAVEARRARPAGFEPAASASGGQRSIH